MLHRSKANNHTGFSPTMQTRPRTPMNQHEFRLYATALFLLVFFALWLSPLHAATSGLPDFTQLTKQNSAAIVNISTTQNMKLGDRNPGFLPPFPNLPDDSPLQDFFRRFFQPPPGLFNAQPVRSLGSGFVVSADGYILTNAHVVQDADKIVVRLSDRREMPARLIGADSYSDVALLKIDATGLPTVQMGDSDKLEIGQWVLAIGSPFGFDHTATQGIISGLQRSLPSDTYVPFIQTDVPVNPGNSGGPLFDTAGKVIGINSQIYSTTGGYMGLSFAIPINEAMHVAEQLKATGHVTRGWLGVSIQPVDPDLAKAFKLGQAQGALIAQVTPDSPAAKAGLKPGDVIIRYDGKPVDEASSLPPMVSDTPIGKSAQLGIMRDGQERTATVTIGRLPDQQTAAVTNPAEGARLNLAVQDLPQEQRSQLGVGDRGVLVTQVGNGPAAEAGIQPGDVILSVDHKDVRSARQLVELVKELPTGTTIPVLVQRDENPVFLALQVPAHG